ncbi:MAG: hypothetical protein B7X41_12535 [Microbacterium sp. 14-71-5]|nr:MAG: hypothetical protein B7X41_12535 [Microbacterium sp. 14-71-5]
MGLTALRVASCCAALRGRHFLRLFRLGQQVLAVRGLARGILAVELVGQLLVARGLRPRLLHLRGVARVGHIHRPALRAWRMDVGVAAAVDLLRRGRPGPPGQARRDQRDRRARGGQDAGEV